MSTKTDPSTWWVSIRSSPERGNAPPGYLIAHVELVPGVLFAQCERNPFTQGMWRYISYHWGDSDETTPGDCLASQCVDNLADDSIGRAVLGLLENVSAWLPWYYVEGVRYCTFCRTRRCKRQVGGTLECVLAAGGLP